MLGTVLKIEPYTITFLIRRYCSVKLHKVFLNGVKSSLEIGVKVRYEVEDSTNSKLPKLIAIEAYEYDNCEDCGRSYELADAQVVSIKLLRLNIFSSTSYIVKINYRA